MVLDAEDQITDFLASARSGHAQAQNQVWSAIYEELRKIADQQMARERADHVLQPTALIHEAFVRLFDGSPTPWANRRHFFGSAARVMRQILIDYARKRKSLKRGGDRIESEVKASIAGPSLDPTELLAVDDALDKLEQEDSQKAKIVELKYFVGLTIDECATVLGIAPRTVNKEWRFARIWLYQELSKGDSSVQKLHDDAS